MQHDEVAQCLAELGHSTRLAVFRLLVKAGPQGLPVGEIQTALEIPASTLSHHLSRLMKVGLIEQERASRTLYCKPNYPRLKAALDFLLDECCAGQGSRCQL